LMLTSVFHHLWFLWFLCWLVPISAAVAEGARRLGGPRLPAHRVAAPATLAAFFALTLIPQFLMGVLAPGFGPDTSTGLIPQPHVLAYYGVFFAFGAMLHDAGAAGEAIGRRWGLWLLASLGVALPVGLLTVDRPVVTGLAQAAYAWGMVVGLIGLARDRLSVERRALRYLANTSYWLYLTHLPLVIALQDWARALDDPAWVKFALIWAATVAPLLAVYEVAIRLGRHLAGGPTQPQAAGPRRDPATPRRSRPCRSIDWRL
ncbi:MAG: acyltransferase family protein, partial [Thermoleophilia bacterium]|nr:acyltransferase family protein [Thermoleophilia bacterium]